MDMQKLNSWLGLLANLGVIAGIFFLALEVRDSRNATEIQMLDSVAEGHNLALLTMVSDPQVANAIVVGFHAPDLLSDPEAAQFAGFMRQYFNHLLRMRRLHEIGLIEDKEWQFDLEQAASFLSTPGGRLFRSSNQEEFDEWCVELCTEMEPFIGREPKWSLNLGRGVKVSN